jgi:rubrerythrin
MQRFIARENIRRFKQQLAACTDDSQASTLRRLLAEEEAHLAELDAQLRSAS